MTTSSRAVDVKAFWRTLGERAIGMTLVTTQSDQGPAGFIALSAAHVTADPPTMLVSIDHGTTARTGVLSRRHFAVNFLPAGAKGLVDSFSGKAGPSGAARFRDEDWVTLTTGAPVFREALGVFDCTVEDVIERGETSIVIGAVVGASARHAGEPLIFFRGKMLPD